MINSISSFLFGATSEGYSNCAARDVMGNVLTTTPTDDEQWLLVDKCNPSAPPLETSPLENLLIEHPSMSVYGSAARSRTGRSPEPATAPGKNYQLLDVQAVVTSRPTVRACATARSEPYNLRRSTLQKSRSTKKHTTRKAFQRQNQTAYRHINMRHSVASRIVFQPRK